MLIYTCLYSARRSEGFMRKHNERKPHDSSLLIRTCLGFASISSTALLVPVLLAPAGQGRDHR